MTNRARSSGSPARWRGLRRGALGWFGFVAGCSTLGVGLDPGDPSDPGSIKIVNEAFETPRSPADNIDSAAVWHGPNGEHWLLATAKEGNRILVFNAATGALVRFTGTEGEGPGQFDRPNGIAVVDDLAFVVERDNERVQVLSLPALESVGVFGDAILETPYGVAIVIAGAGLYDVFITDNFAADTDSELSDRVRHFRVQAGAGGLRADLVRSFGDTSGPGRLHEVETIAADGESNILLLAEEREPSTLKVYTLDGVFAGTVLDPIYFPHEAEGIALYQCEGGGGYWIATDQHDDDNTFRVFDRVDLSYLGSFSGSFVRNTDGVALTQVPFGPFPDGVFYAVHDDASLAAFSWKSIAEALGLRRDC